MPSNRKHHLLARVNFPLYTVLSLTERHVLVAGGGGGSKTGVPNVIEIYELINNGSTCRAVSVFHYETGSEAIMNCTVFNAGNFFVLFAGMEGNCKVYKLKYELSDEHMVDQSVDSENHTFVRRRARPEGEKEISRETVPSISEQSDSNANLIPSGIHFNIQCLESFQTDFSSDPSQKIVRFSRIAKILVTAGDDGYVRVWKYPKLNMIHEIHAHQARVDDIDICPLGKQIVSISRDGHGRVWNSESGTLISDLKYTLPPKSHEKYIFRNCRYGIVDDKNDSVLFATLNPAVRKKPSSQCYICKWDTKQFSMEKIVSTGIDMLSVMAISGDGRFVGLGTSEGGVKMYIAFNLQLLYNMEKVHRIFVTDLEFLQTCEQSRRITGGYESSLISISVDNHINIHHIPARGEMGILAFLTLLILTMFFIFVMMDFLNL